MPTNASSSFTAAKDKVHAILSTAQNYARRDFQTAGSFNAAEITDLTMVHLREVVQELLRDCAEIFPREAVKLNSFGASGPPEVSRGLEKGTPDIRPGTPLERPFAGGRSYTGYCQWCHHTFHSAEELRQHEQSHGAAGKGRPHDAK